MKKLIFSLLFLVTFMVTDLLANELQSQAPSTHSPVSIGMVIYSNDVETVWNAFRLANHSVSLGDTVQVFLLAKGVEVDLLVNDHPELKEQVDIFLEKGGEIQGCGTCLKRRNNDDPEVCTFSSMADLYNVVRRNKIVLTF